MLSSDMVHTKPSCLGDDVNILLKGQFGMDLAWSFAQPGSLLVYSILLAVAVPALTAELVPWSRRRVLFLALMGAAVFVGGLAGVGTVVDSVASVDEARGRAVIDALFTFVLRLVAIGVLVRVWAAGGGEEVTNRSPAGAGRGSALLGVSSAVFASVVIVAYGDGALGPVAAPVDVGATAAFVLAALWRARRG